MKNIRVLIFIVLGLFSTSVKAGVFELGGTASYNHNSYNGGTVTWTRSYTANFGYFFTADSELEFSYQDSTNEEKVPGVQDITYRDRVYSINFLYHFFDETSAFRPYLRAGVGQLNRDATGWYQGGYSPAGRLDQVTVIGGIGLKVKIYSRFSLKAEATTYLSGGSISSYRDNVSLNIGGSIYF